jgi:hypothetical protein
MDSHVVPMKDSKVPYVRTGYETVFPLTVEKKFVTIAEQDGVVDNVTKDNISVIYKDKSKDKIKLYSWTTKEESGSTYTHKLVTSFVKGAKFLKGDSLAYDELFFEPDIFNKNRVLYKQGSRLTTALMEDASTYEDSAILSKSMSLKMGTMVTKVKSIVIDVEDNLLKMVQVGDKLTPSDILFTTMDKNIGDVDKLDNRALEILQNIKTASPKSKVHGKVSKVQIIYNCDLSDMSRTLKKLTIASDEELMKKEGYTGQVNSSYSIDGKALLEMKAEIKIYIDVFIGMGIGDKAIFGNQLKFTVGEVFDYTMQTQDGTDLEAVFSSRSIEARITHSSNIHGTTAALLEKVSKNAVERYFK